MNKIPTKHAILLVLSAMSGMGLRINDPSEHTVLQSETFGPIDDGQGQGSIRLGANMYSPDIKWSIKKHCCLKEEEGGYGDANMEFSGEPIPNIVFTMGPYRPEEIEAANKKMFPEGTEFRFFNHNDLWPEIKKISKHLEEEVNITGAADAFAKYRPHSYQSDIWRPMMLWEYGGYYLDAKLQLTKPVETWVSRSKDMLAVCRDIPLDRDRFPIQPEYWSAMLAAPKRSPMLLAIIQKLIDNANEKVYPVVGHANLIGKLYVAGPGAFTDGLHERGHKPAMRCTNDGHKITDVEGNEVADIVENVHSGMRTCEDCDAYGQLYKRGQAYCDEPGPPCKKYE